MDIQNLYKHYDGIVAVDHVVMSIFPYTINGIYGDNGAGKSVLLNLLSGIEKPDTGKIIYKGKDITNTTLLKRAKLGIGRLFQTPRVFTDVNVLDNLMAAGNNHEAKYLHNYLFKHSSIKKNIKEDENKALHILEKFKLSEKAALKAYELSVGEKKLLSLGCLLMSDARFILLDEPLASINANMIDIIKNILMSLKKDGITLLIIEHDKAKLFEMADFIYEMKNGKLEGK